MVRKILILMPPSQRRPGFEGFVSAKTRNALFQATRLPSEVPHRWVDFPHVLSQMTNRVDMLFD